MKKHLDTAIFYGDPSDWANACSMIWCPRDIDWDHVEELKESYLESGVMPTLPSIILVSHIYDVPPEEWCEETVDKLWRSIKLMAPFSGNHRRSALCLLQKQYPQNQQWKEVPFRVLMCPDNADSMQMLRVYGRKQNRVDSIHRDITYSELLLNARKDYVVECMMEMKSQLPASEQNEPIRMHQVDAHTLTKGRVSMLCEGWITSYGKKKGAVAQISSLVKLSSPVWDILKRILKTAPDAPSPRSGKKKKSDQLKSAAHLLHIVKLPVGHQVQLVESVLSGRKTWRAMGNQARSWKSEIDLRAYIMDQVDPEHKLDNNWIEAEEAFPTICQDDFVNKWIAVMIGQRSSLSIPVDFKTELDERIRLHQEDFKRTKVHNNY